MKSTTKEALLETAMLIITVCMGILVFGTAGTFLYNMVAALITSL